MANANGVLLPRSEVGDPHGRAAVALGGVARSAYADILKLAVEDLPLWPELFIQDSKMSSGEPKGPEPHAMFSPTVRLL